MDIKKTALILGALILAGSNSEAYATEVKPIIAHEAKFKVYIEKEEFNPIDPIMIIDGSTYLPLTEFSKILGVKVNWNTEKRCLEIEKNNIAEEVKPLESSNGLNIKYMNPNNGQQDVYLKWGYINIVFNEDIKGVKDLDKIYLISEDGERINIKSSQPGITAKDNMIISPSKELKLDTSYKLIIPKNTMQSESGKFFDQEIIVDFKTAKNIVKGKIGTTENYFGKTLILKKEENSYSTSIVGENEFDFTDIPVGKYELILKEQGNIVIQSNIDVKEDKINEFIIK